MIYKTTYLDASNRLRTLKLTDADCREYARNDLEIVRRTYDPRRVILAERPGKPGEMGRLEVTVKAPSHYLTGVDDFTPKPCSCMTATIIIPMGYPIQKLEVFYNPTCYLASPNVFRSGAACIDKWRVLTSSLITVVAKIVFDMIHDPSVTLYSSPANATMIQWHKQGVARGEFPTLSPKRLLAPEAPPVVHRR